MIEIIPTCQQCENEGCFICEGCTAIGCVFFIIKTSLKKATAKASA